jgi:predicted phosphoribosyltransferase
VYFTDRSQAGELLATRLAKYRYENSAVLALSTGGVQVGERIARKLHCTLSLLMTARITAPGDVSLVLGTIDQEGDFTYNNLIPAGEMEEYMQDMHNYLEEEKLRHLYDMASLIGEGGLVKREMLAGRNVIIVTDGVKNGMSFDAALQYLKLIPTEKVIAAIPVGPAEVMERVSRMVDELHYLYIPDNFITVSHYYEDNTKLDPETVIRSINEVVSQWQ